MKGMIVLGMERKMGFTKMMVLAAAVTMITAAAQPVKSFAADVSPSGSGTVLDPYVLVNQADLKWFSNKVNGGEGAINVRLGADIDAVNLIIAPIGSPDDPFKGTFDGDGHKIKNLKVSKPKDNNVGFFGYTEYGSVIKNLGLENEKISGGSFTGGLVGRSYSQIENCYTTGSVTSSFNSYNIGGLAGNNHGAISDSYSKATVNGSSTSFRVGGLVGQNAGTPNSPAEIKGSYSEGSVFGHWIIGGLVGENAKFAQVTDSTSSGGVAGRGDFVGGLIGRTVQ